MPESALRHASLRDIVVDKVTDEATDVRSFVLRDARGAPLPAWAPGAHVDVMLPSGLARQYSLCGDESDLGSYRVAVLRQPDGLVSLQLHADDLLGTTLRLGGPRNHFELVDAPGYRFIAGGIGITPILAMATSVARTGRPWRLTYGGRTRDSMAFIDELAAIPGGELVIAPEDEDGILPLRELVADTPEGHAIYACGPDGMLKALEGECIAQNRTADLHLERFTKAEPAAPAATGGFEVELRASGMVLDIPPDRSILEVVREALPDVMFSCEEGFCGLCETRVLEGVPEHHDSVLTDADRARGDTMMICVGRTACRRLVLDL